MVITDVKQLKAHIAIKKTIYTDNNPFKKSVCWYFVNQNNLYKNNGNNGLTLDFKCNQPDNYTFLERKSIITFDNNWLNDPSHCLEFFDFQEQQGSDEESLNILIQNLRIKQCFHTSNHFLFDIDGYERTKEGFKFSDSKSLFAKDKFEYRNGAHYLTEESIHRPVPLKIAKFKKPKFLKLKTGETVLITHITEIGELVYSAKGLRSIDRQLLEKGFTSKIYENHIYLDMEDSIEDFLIGDIAQYRSDFI